MNEPKLVEITFGVISSVMIVASVLFDCHNPFYTLIALIPLSEAAFSYHAPPTYAFRANSIFGFIRIFVLIVMNKELSSSESPSLMNFPDVIEIFLMAPSLLADKAKNVIHVLFYMVLIRTQHINDSGHVPYRYWMKAMCFLVFNFMGYYKYAVQERLFTKLHAHYFLTKRMDTQKANVSKAFRSAVGWNSFDEHRSKRRLSQRRSAERFQDQLLNSDILVRHDLSDFKRTVDAARLYNCVSRNNCILIAIKPFTAGTLTSCAAQNSYDMSEIFTKINSLARKYYITIVRKFGDVWIGCLGFFRGGNNDMSANVRGVLDMAKDVHAFGNEKNIKFTCAIECGNVFCGFFRGIFQFEILGPEVIWIVSVCEFEEDQHVYVGGPFHDLCNLNENNTHYFEVVSLQHVRKFHSGSNYILVLDKIPKTFYPSDEVSSSKTFRVESWGSAKENNPPPNENHFNVTVESQQHMAMTLKILHSLLYGEACSSANVSINKMKRAAKCCFRQATYPMPVHAASPNAADTVSSECSFDPTSLKQPTPLLRPMFDAYPDYSFTISTTMMAALRTFFKYVVSISGYSVLCSSTNVKESLASKGVERGEYESFDDFRKKMLEPSSVFADGYIFLFLIVSIVIMFQIELGGVSFNFACVLVVVSFFNWVVPLHDPCSLILPTCNVIFFVLHPPETGRMGAIVMLPTWMVLCYSHRLSHVAFSVVAVLLIYSILKDKNECGDGLMLFSFVGFFFLSAACLLEYYICLLYVVEKRVIPYENYVIFFYEEAMRGIYNSSLETIGSQSTPHPVKRSNPLPSNFQCYERCVVIAVHIKAAETFSDVGSVDHVSNILEYIYSLFDECTEMFGILGMSKFAGVHLSAIRDDGRSKESNLKRGVACVQHILSNFRALDQESHVHLNLGICLNYGPLNTGMFEEHSRAYFDMTGATRDKALKMALQQENTIFFSSKFLNEMRIAFPKKEFKNCTHGSVTSGQQYSSSNVEWYQVELSDAFNFAGNFGFSRGMKNYEYKEVLGKGGNGAVLLLEDKATAVKVAVKIIKWDFDSIDYTRREISILQDLKHPNIVIVKHCVVMHEELYIVMEYIEGGTLKQIVDSKDKPNREEFRKWFKELVYALAYIHERGIIHRDVKPSNCMINSYGVLKLTDFGLAFQHGKSITDGKHNSSRVNKKSGVQLSDPSLMLLQNCYPPSVLYNKVSENDKMRQNGGVVQPENKRKEGILLIDDDRQRLERTQNLLRTHFIVYSVNNDNEALDFLKYSLKKKSSPDPMKINDSANENEICLIIISIDFSKDARDGTNGWGFLNIIWEKKENSEEHIVTKPSTGELYSDEMREIPVIALASSLPLLKSDEDKIWQARLSKDSREKQPKQIICHPFSKEVYEKNRYYFDMVCRLEKQRKHLQSDEALTVFDNMIEKHVNSQERVIPQENNMAESKGVGGVKDVKVVPSEPGRGESASGTLSYMAPEVLNKNMMVNEKVDWWSCGATFFYCITGRKLFDRKTKYWIAKEIQGVNIESMLDATYSLPTDLSKLIKGMLIRDVALRFGAHQIKNHEYFAPLRDESTGEVVKKMRKFVPLASFECNTNVTAAPDLQQQAENDEKMHRNVSNRRHARPFQHTPSTRYSSEYRLRKQWSMNVRTDISKNKTNSYTQSGH